MLAATAPAHSPSVAVAHHSVATLLGQPFSGQRAAAIFSQKSPERGARGLALPPGDYGKGKRPWRAPATKALLLPSHTAPEPFLQSPVWTLGHGVVKPVRRCAVCANSQQPWAAGIPLRVHIRGQQATFGLAQLVERAAESAPQQDQQR